MKNKRFTIFVRWFLKLKLDDYIEKTTHDLKSSH